MNYYGGEEFNKERANCEVDIHETIDGQISLVDDGSNNIEKRLRLKSISLKRFLPYFMMAVVGSIIGGLLVGVAAFTLVPKIPAFRNTALYQVASKDKQGMQKTEFLSASMGMLSVSEIAKQVGPAVVGVSSISTTQVQDVFGFGWPFSTEQEQESMGSGIIFNQDGYIVTNYHVIKGSQQIKVILKNGKEVKAKVINYDSAADIAVIKMTEKVDIPGIAEFGDSDVLEVGEPAVAIGNPLGKDLLGTVTAGVISATNREIEIEGRKLKLIQTDAAINPGNSGGPLINSKGQVIGINTVKMTEYAVEGLGFAIPINDVKPKIQELLTPRLKIGIKGREITSDLSKKYDLPIGVYVLSVEDFSPAQRAGIQSYDVIMKFAGEKVKTVDEINKIKNKYKAGDEVNVEISRDGQTKTLKLKLAEEN